MKCHKIFLFLSLILWHDGMSRNSLGDILSWTCLHGVCWFLSTWHLFYCPTGKMEHGGKCLCLSSLTGRPTLRGRSHLKWQITGLCGDCHWAMSCTKTGQLFMHWLSDAPILDICNTCSKYVLNKTLFNLQQVAWKLFPVVSMQTIFCTVRCSKWSVRLEGAQSRATAPLHQKEAAEVVWASDQDASWTPPFRGDPEHTGKIRCQYTHYSFSRKWRRRWRIVQNIHATQCSLLAPSSVQQWWMNRWFSESPSLQNQLCLVGFGKNLSLLET